jgi:hypothetical protein
MSDEVILCNALPTILAKQQTGKKCRVLRDSASFAKLCKTSVSERQQAPK